MVFRGSHDFIITGDSKELLESEVRPLVEQFLRERGLKLSPDKTRITHIDEGFDFLGQNLRKYDGKPLVKPSKKNTHAFLEKVRDIIGKNGTVPQSLLIDRLNPVIRGWANYHQHAAATGTFDRVDHEVWRRLWRWARRRHPNQSAAWVKKRYFPALDGRNWVFAVKTEKRTADGRPIWKRLVWASDTKIRRHVNIRKEANPFYPSWQPYFEERAFRKKFGISRHQAGIQPPCRRSRSCGALSRLEPDEGKLCAMSRATRIPDRVGRSSGLILRDEPTHLNPKGGGENSMLVKREAPEDVWGADLQHLDDTAKAGLLESQSPAVELHTRR